MGFTDGIVIVGCGVAGVAAAETIRLYDEEIPVTVVTKEPYPFYSRAEITEVLAGLKKPEDIIIYGDDWFRESNITLLKGVEVTGILTSRRKVVLSDGSAIKYDYLIIASGSRPTPLRIPGIDMEGIHHFQTLDDAVAVSKELEGSSSILIVGGGPIGVKVAEAVARRGGLKRITIVEKLSFLLPRFLDPECAGIVKADMERFGVKVETGVSVREFRGDGRVREALLEDGRTLECDLAVIAIGVRPNLSFIRGTGIMVNRGILVDEYMRTSIPGIYAAGDVAEFVDPSTGKGVVNPVWPVAYIQGVTAALHILGRAKRYTGSIPMNAMSLFDKPLISFGKIYPVPEDCEEVVLRDRGTYRKFVVRGDSVEGALFYGDAKGAGTLFTLALNKLSVPNILEALRMDMLSYSYLLGAAGLLDGGVAGLVRV